MRWLLWSLAALALTLGGAVAWIYHQGGAAQKTKETVAAAEQKTAVANLNTEGVRQSEQRVRVTVATQQSAASLAAKYRAEAEAAGDAHDALEADRARRLRAMDDGLCSLDRDVCAAGRNAGDGAGPVFALPTP